jgi:membrane protease YdiL (CAAX protease family)
MNRLFLKEGWRPFVNPLAVAVAFTIIFGAIRGLGMLGPPRYRPLIPLGFICMMALPFIFLTKDGRREIGLNPSNRTIYYAIGILFGLTASAVCFGIGLLLFDTGPDNWFITIRNYYLNTPSTAAVSTFQLFFIFTIPAMTFSPIGEEIFFRGFLQEALNSRFTVQTSILFESLLFGVVHVFHHGFVRMADGSIQVYFWSGILWVGLMFLTAYGFALIRKVSTSIYPAMVAHTTFNLMMNVFIFSFLWKT